MTKREDDGLREFFRQVHADDPVASFEQVMRSRPRQARSRQWAVVAASLVAAATLLWWLWAPQPTATLSTAEQMVLAVELSIVDAPLDFLLETPGQEMYAVPSFGTFDRVVVTPTGEQEMLQ